MTFLTPERKLKALMRGEPFHAGNPSFVCKKQIVGRKVSQSKFIGSFFFIVRCFRREGECFRTDEYLHILEPRLMQKCVKYYFCCFWRNKCCQRVPFRFRCPWTFAAGALNCYFARSRVIYFRAQIFELICRRVCSLCIGRFRLRRSAKIWDFPWDYKGVSSANLP